MAAAARGDVLVVVDVLSFSTLVVTAVARGASVVPCRPGDEAAAASRHPGAVVAVARGALSVASPFSLSPPTALAAGPGTTLVVGSPNGATCAAAAAGCAAVFAGCLRNAAAVAAAVRALGRPVTVLACGERWAADGAHRVALEDDLGAGAILAGLELGAASPEARAAAAQFAAVRSELAALVGGCASALELRARGFGGDVTHAAALDADPAAPSLVAGVFEGASLPLSSM